MKHFHNNNNPSTSGATCETTQSLTIRPVARFHSPLTSKFGIPRQSGVVESLEGRIVFSKEYRSLDAIRGLDDFDYLWLLWGFSANKHEARGVTVRPPRLGGNEHLGVFATRSPYRPNPIGLSSVRIERIAYDEKDGPVIYVKGADLMDGTPIYDIKPYIAYADSHPGSRGGFTDKKEWQPLKVVIPENINAQFSQSEIESLYGVLAQDPRPQYHNDPDRIYGMPFAGYDVRFRVADGVLTVVEVRVGL